MDVWIFQVLQVQIAACEKQREDEEKLKEMEAQWLKEEAQLRAEEEKWLQEEKLRKQKAAKRSREVSIRLKKEKEVGSHLCIYLNITLCHTNTISNKYN